MKKYLLLLPIALIFLGAGCQSKLMAVKTVKVSDYYDGQSGYSLSVPSGDESTCMWTWAGGSGNIPNSETTHAKSLQSHIIKIEDISSAYDFKVNCTDDFGDSYTGVFPKK
ncbi:MAG: hypothetical protein NTW66_00485 [Candidatus Magasanikbacteria bacterium]|nr:hypothetical protein [Candidatus Magasanikbacteria bacterium]